MTRIRSQRAAFSKVSVKYRTIIPLEVRSQLKLKPGDTLRYRVTDGGILLDKATEAGDDPFELFSEWTSDVDEKIYSGLRSSFQSAKVGRPPTPPTPRKRR